MSEVYISPQPTGQTLVCVNSRPLSAVTVSSCSAGEVLFDLSDDEKELHNRREEPPVRRYSKTCDADSSTAS
jgi:hypothetical protein